MNMATPQDTTQVVRVHREETDRATGEAKRKLKVALARLDRARDDVAAAADELVRTRSDRPPALKIGNNGTH